MLLSHASISTEPRPGVASVGEVRPLFSVAIVTFNRERQLTRAIDSVLSQRRNDVEIVVVDNNSTDGTADMIRRYYPNVRLIVLPRNVGCPDGRNHAFANCRGQYIVNLDDDGWLSEGSLEALESIFATDATIGIVAMRQAYPEEDGSKGRAMSAVISDVGLFSGGVSAFRKTMLAATGGYPRDFFLFAEESYLSIRALEAKFRIVSAPHIIMWHPRVGGSHLDISKDYHLFRNSLMVVLRLYPGTLLIRYLILRAGSQFFAAIRRRSLTQYWRAIGSIFSALPRTLLNRTPASADAVRKHLNGRNAWSESR